MQFFVIINETAMQLNIVLVNLSSECNVNELASIEHEKLSLEDDQNNICQFEQEPKIQQEQQDIHQRLISDEIEAGKS